MIDAVVASRAQKLSNCAHLAGPHFFIEKACVCLASVYNESMATTRKPRPLSIAMMRMLVRLLAGPVAFRSSNSVRALVRRGMLERLDDGRVKLSHWGRIHALKVRTHPQVQGW